MPDNDGEGFGYTTSSLQEQVDAAMGMADAHMVTIIALMRVISQGLTGEHAYQKIAGDLSAELAQPAMFGVRGKAKQVQLHMLASTFQQKPPSGSA